MAVQDVGFDLDLESGIELVNEEQTAWSEVMINNWRFKTIGTVGWQSLVTFQGKSTTGDYTVDSNQLFSTWVWNDGTGGIGVNDMNEVSDAATYRIGTLYPRYRKQISKGYRINQRLSESSSEWGTPSVAFSNQTIRFLGDAYVSSAWIGLLSIGEYLWNGTTYTEIGDMNAEPTGKCFLYKGSGPDLNMVIPLGAAGYALFNCTTSALSVVAPSGTVPAAVNILVWADQLVAIDTDGQLWHTVDLTGAWTSYGPDALIPRNFMCRRLVSYFDRNVGAPAIYIVTDVDLWQFDPAGPTLNPVDVQFPPHPDHGLAAIEHDGDLFVTVGMGMHRYTGGSWIASGLDRRDGLPFEYHGAMVDLISGYRGMYALVGESTSQPDLDWIDTSDTTVFKSGLYEFTGTGWHMLWEGEGMSACDNSLFVSRNGNGYRLYWGANSISGLGAGFVLYHIDLPVSFGTPVERSRIIGGFQPNGWLETGWFDASMEGYRKNFAHAQIAPRKLKDGARLIVEYKIDGEDNPWQTLGATSTNGLNAFQFGDNASGVFSGIVAEKIKYRISFDDSSYDGAYFEKIVTAFLKLVNPSDTWNMTLDLQAPWADVNQAIMRARIDSILGSGLMIPMQIGTDTRRVILSQASGTAPMGVDPSCMRMVSVLEIPEEVGVNAQ